MRIASRARLSAFESLSRSDQSAPSPRSARRRGQRGGAADAASRATSAGIAAGSAPGKHRLEDGRLGHRREGRGRVGGCEQLGDLRPDPLAREGLEALAGTGAGGETLHVEPFLRMAVPGEEPEEAQDAQVILGDARRRVADEAHMPGLEVGQAAQGVDQRAVGPGIERVHGEVAPCCILGEVAGEGDGRVAPEGLDIAAEGGDLEGTAAGHQRHRAVGQAGRHRFEPGRLRQGHHRLGRRVGGEVEIGHRLAEQGVAHAAADEERAVALRGERVADRDGLGGGEPVGGEPGHGPGHGARIRSASVRIIRAVAPQM